MHISSHALSTAAPFQAAEHSQQKLVSMWGEQMIGRKVQGRSHREAKESRRPKHLRNNRHRRGRVLGPNLSTGTGRQQASKRQNKPCRA
jgi:hypothetical protein